MVLIWLSSIKLIKKPGLNQVVNSRTVFNDNAFITVCLV